MFVSLLISYEISRVAIKEDINLKARFWVLKQNFLGYLLWY